MTPPPYIKPSQEGIIEFYKRLHQDTKANIILYNNPARCGVDMDVATIKVLFTLPRAIGLKDSNTNLERITELSCYNDRKSLLCGEDIMLLDYVVRGGNGAVSIVGNIVPELMTEFFSVHTLERMKNLHDKIHEYVMILNQGGNPAAIKGLMSLVQECQNELRFPLTPLSVHIIEHMKGMLHDIEGHSCQQACHR